MGTALARMEGKGIALLPCQRSQLHATHSSTCCYWWWPIWGGVSAGGMVVTVVDEHVGDSWGGRYADRCGFRSKRAIPLLSAPLPSRVARKRQISGGDASGVVWWGPGPLLPYRRFPLIKPRLLFRRRKGGFLPGESSNSRFVRSARRSLGSSSVVVSKVSAPGSEAAGTL